MGFLLSCYGGTLSVLPAYIADLFGQGNLGAIHGRQLVSFSVAASLGPTLLASLRHMSYKSAVTDLAATVNPAKFQSTFGAPSSDLPMLIEKKTATIPRLLEIAPAGTIDPSPFLYDTTFYALGGLVTSAAICNALLRKVDASHFVFDAPVVVDSPPEGDEKKLLKKTVEEVSKP